MSLHDGLIACFPLNSDGNDALGNYDGTVSGATFVSGKLGNCADFDGTDDYISVDPIAELNGAETFTIAFWVNIDSNAANQSLFEFAADAYNGIFIKKDAPYLEFYVYNNGYVGSGSAPFSYGAWYLIVWTYDGSLGPYDFSVDSSPIKVYRNNSLLGLGGNGGNVATMTAPTACIGSNYVHDDDYFDGKIDELYIWNRVLTSDERTELYNSGDGLAYPFGELSVGPFETTAELTGHQNLVQVGSFETTAEITATPSNGNIYFSYAFGTESLKKIYTSPYLAETIDYELSSIYTPLKFCVDDDGNFYLGLYDGNYYTWAKFGSDGSLIWHKIIPFNTAVTSAMATDGTDLFIATPYTGGRVRKYSGVDGSEITTGNWPITDSVVVGNSPQVLKIGRDGYLYLGSNGGVGQDGHIHKFDPSDGSEEWDYQVPHILEDSLSVNDIDINSDGYVAIACIGRLETAATEDLSVIVLDSSGTIDSSTNNFLDFIPQIRIDEAGYVYLNFYGNYTHDVGKYDPSDWSEIWAKGGWYQGPISDLTPDETGIYYMSTGAVNDLTRVYFIDTATGAVLNSWPDENGTPDLFIKNSETPAWYISITAGANGTVTNSLGAEFETGTYLFPAGEDVTLSFTGDTGYDVRIVSVDSASQGKVTEYTFTALDGQHEIEIEFIRAESAGDLEADAEIEANYQISLSPGSFEATAELTGTPLLPVVAGSFETVAELGANFQIDISVGAFEATSELTGTTLQSIPTGEFETTSELTGAAGDFTVSAGDFETTAEITGDGQEITTDGMVPLFKMVLTGDADGTTDIAIPISSFQMRMYSGSSTYLSVTIPNIDYADEISARANGNLDLYLMYAEPSDLENPTIEKRVVVVALETVVLDNGSINKSVSLSGYETTAQRNAREANPKTVTLDDSWFNYVRTSSGLTTARMVKPHLTLSAGDTISYDGSTFTASRITWVESDSYHYMEIAEAA